MDGRRDRLNLASMATFAAAFLASGMVGPEVRAADCSIQPLSIMKASLTAARHIVVPVMLNDIEHSFILDTGASIGVLTQHALERLKLREVSYDRLKLSGLGGEAVIGRATIPRVRLGQLVGEDLPVLVLDDTTDRPMSFDGLLGGDALSNYDVEVDLSDGWVKLFSHDRCATVPAYWAEHFYAVPFHLTNSHHIELRPELNGQEMSAWLDSGAPRTTLSWHIASLLDIDKNTPGVEPLTSPVHGIDGKPLEAYSYQLKLVRIGDVGLKNYPIQITSYKIEGQSWFASDPKKPERAAEILIGAEFFYLNRVYIAYGEHKIYFTPYAADQVKAILSHPTP
jgi:predicted aspartyl protease